MKILVCFMMDLFLLVSQVISPQFFHYNFIHFSHAHHHVHVDLLWFDHTNNIWWKVQIMNLLNMYFSPASVTFPVVGPNIDLPQHPVLIYTDSVFFT